MQTPTLLSPAEVTRRLGIGRSTLHRYRQAGNFPHPIPLGPRRIAWPEEDIADWLNRQRG
ncbi:AlpA family phage regulatory protein [Sphingomonas sanguinis]|uniref:helix-turn-helix transcriptional regulator n=1 Tax=Sphingomonas sanguinis TaxID=33051 RepID=UPI0009EB9CA4